MEHRSVIKLDQATRMLAEIHTIDDAKELIDLAEAARIYARQVHLGLEAQNHAAEIKIRAQRRAGEILDSMEKAKGGEQYHTTPYQGEGVVSPTYADLGINYKQAHIWQTLASMPDQLFDNFIADRRTAIDEITTSGIYREAKRYIAKSKSDAPDLPIDKYSIIYADPPWQYGDRLIDGYGPAEFHYPTMSTDELASLDIGGLAQDNSVLFLWTTSPMLPEAMEIIEAWGFRYKASFVWDKVKHNYGHYNSVRHELLLLCTRGSYLPEVSQLFDSVISIERTDHSTKPEYFRTIIDTLYPTGKRIELFARRTTPGWEAWGNESDT